MSNKVDERITRIRFDNDQFERGVATSMQSLDRLKNKLEDTESINAFSGIEKAANNTDISALGRAVESISDKFSTLRMVAINVLSDIASSAIQTGIEFTKSLSVDNIAAGWQKYDEEVQAVQTIMVTLDDTPMADVEASLEKIAWFSDETSYSYNQMVSSMSKLISSGVNLQDATNAVIGLADAAAAAGVSTTKAEQAFYNFSQAFGAGYMQLQDWRSIELLNMATPEFKQNIINTAKALGKIVQVGDGLYATQENIDKEDNWFGVNNMRQSLKDKWFDTDVMNQVLGLYSQFTDQVYQAQHAWDLDTAKQTMDQLTEMGIAIDNVSNKAFRAAQEAKTFAEAVDATKDAVSTKWKQTFSTIFGNYEQAKELWSDLAEELYDLFAASGDTRNELLKQWNDPAFLKSGALLPGEKLDEMFRFPELKAGRDVLLEGLWNIFHSIVNVVNAIKEAWREVFPQMTARKLYTLTVKFRDFTEKILKSTENLDTLKTVLRGIFKIIRAGLNVFKKVLSFAKELWPIGKKLLEIIVAVGKQIIHFFADSEKLTKGLNKATPIFEKIIDFLKKLKDAFLAIDTDNIKLPTFDEFLESIKKVKDNLGGFKDKFSEVFKTISDKVTNFLPGKKMEEVGEYLTLVATDADGSSSILSRAFSNYNMLLADSEDNTETILGKLKRVSKSFFTWVGDQFKDFKLDDLIGVGIIMVLSKFVWNLGDLSKQLGGILSSVSSLIKNIGGVFGSLSNLLQRKAFTEISKAVRNFALSVLAIAGAIWLIASIKGDATEAIDIVLNMVIGLVIIHTVMT